MIEQGVALLCSVGTLTGMWLAGNGRRAGWAISLATEALWVVFIVMFGAWGLVPLTVALAFVYGRNLWRWSRRPTPDGSRWLLTDNGQWVESHD